MTRPARIRRGRTVPFRVAIAAALLLVVTFAAVAQESDSSGGSVFAPFISRIRISMRDPEVRLTWQDSADVDGGYRIYRHTSEITAATFLDAQYVGDVDSGVQSFIDAPQAPGEYYYAVVAWSDAGEVYEIFIPYRNTTSLPVTVANTATPEERAARVWNIAAHSEGFSILIDYESDQVDRELIIYRATSPFISAADLSRAGVVATVTSGVESVMDYPVPGVPYYYGVVDAELVADGTVVFQPGVNTLSAPVEIPLEQIASMLQAEPEPETTPTMDTTAEDATATDQTVPVEAAAETQTTTTTTTAEVAVDESVFVPDVSRRRPLPLPFLQLNTDLETGESLGDAAISVPSRQSITAETQTALAAMMSRLAVSPGESMSPEVLSEDTLPDPRGAEYMLRTIVDGAFINMAWEDALLQLNNFLSLPLTGDVRARALFYRAQCYYFTGDNRRAFVEFLLARNAYFEEVEGWLDVILDGTAGA